MSESVYTSDERARLRAELIQYASADPRLSGGALTGSAAEDREDRWSDIDLAFGVADAALLPRVLADWTDRMYTRHLALHHLDMRFGDWIYRVFLLPGTLQVDLAFVPAAEFRALAPSFRLLFGKANEPRHAASSPPGDLIGLAWLYALHARTSLARGLLWQAEYMISGLRDHALALACVRHSLPAVHGRGIDRLPPGVTAQFEGTLPAKLELAELRRAFHAAIRGLMVQIRGVDASLADRLEPALAQLAASAA